MAVAAAAVEGVGGDEQWKRMEQTVPTVGVLKSRPHQGYQFGPRVRYSGLIQLLSIG